MTANIEKKRAYSKAGPKFEDLHKLRNTLRNNPRDLLLFDFITTIGIPISKVLPLKIKDLEGLKPGDRLPVFSPARKGKAEFVLTDTVYLTWLQYLDAIKPDEQDYIFMSRKGKKPLTLNAVCQMTKKWYEAAGIEGLTGTKALGKALEVPIHSARASADEKARQSNPVRVLEPPENISLAEAVYKQFLGALVSGRILPGERLTVDSIATRMEVSHIPVREALQRLQESGFLSINRKTGVIINELSIERIEEVLEIRITLETLAARKAALTRRKGTLDKLEALQREYEYNAVFHNVDKLLKINKEFHHTIYREADMPILENIIEGLWYRMSPYFHLLLRMLENTDNQLARQNVTYHAAILESIRQKSPESVTEWLVKDLGEPTRQVIAFYNNLR